MKKNSLPEEPLFSSTQELPSSNYSDADKLNVEEFNAREENSRKNKVLDFCFKASIWVLGFVIVLIIADLYAQTNKLDGSLIKECLSLTTYIVTAALGFIFGSNGK